MAARELFLVELPPNVAPSEVTKAKTVEELDHLCSRMTDTIEKDLKSRLFVYREDREKWYAGRCSTTQRQKSKESISMFRRWRKNLTIMSTSKEAGSLEHTKELNDSDDFTQKYFKVYQHYQDCAFGCIYQYYQMKSNKSLTNKPTIIKKIEHFVWHDSTSMANTIIKDIMQLVNCEVGKIEKAKSQQRKLIQFGKIRQSNYIYGYLNQMLADPPSKTYFSQDQQPSNIMIDTLAIASLQKTQNKNVKSVIFEQNTLTQSFISQVNTEKSKNNKQPSIKLPLQTIEQVKFITEMRQKKYDDQQKIKKQVDVKHLQKEKSLKRQNQLQIKVNFDYNGNILYRKNIEYGNLVLKNIEQKLTKQKRIKKVEQTPQAEQVQPIQKQKYMKKNRSKLMQDEFTQFLDSQSLADSIDINRGIRYSHNALVLQQKKHILSSSSLKNQLGNRKFSKQELQRVKQLDQKVRSSRLRKLKTEQFKASNFTHKRSLSEANFASSRFRKRQVINVMNPQLRSSMLIRLSEYQPFLVIQKEFPQDPNLFYEQKEPETIINSSQLQQNEVDSKSFVTDRTRMTPKLPPINRKIQANKSIEDQLIIGKLQKQLQNKLRI